VFPALSGVENEIEGVGVRSKWMHARALLMIVSAFCRRAPFRTAAASVSAPISQIVSILIAVSHPAAPAPPSSEKKNNKFAKFARL
jgi:hypothetical protein